MLEDFGLQFVRFSDFEVKKAMNDVLRILENVVSELSEKNNSKDPHPPGPLQRGSQNYNGFKLLQQQ
jgi:hypothetical protein